MLALIRPLDWGSQITGLGGYTGMENRGFYEVYKYGDQLLPGLKLKIEHSVSLAQDKTDISQLVPLPLRELERRREESVNAEKAIFEQICASVAKWEEQASITQLLDSAIQYDKTPVVSHSSNKWQADENGNHSRSNAVYKMTWRVYEETRYDREIKASVPVAWRLTWDVSLNTPVRDYFYSSKGKIAGQDNKRFTDKASMEKYLQGRIAAYSHLFTEISPPIPREYAVLFKVNGLLLPGYTITDKAAEQERSEVYPSQNSDKTAPGNEKESVLEQIAADREKRKARGAAAHENPAPARMRRGNEEVL